MSVAWGLATNTRQVAGVIGAGANLPPGQLASPPPMPFFGAAGRSDFKLAETRAAVDTVLRGGGRARFEQFEGRHEWPTPALAREALAWLELDAMRLGTRPRDRQVIDRELTAAGLAIDALEAAGQWADALRRANAAVASLAPLTDVAALRTRRDALASRREVVRALEEERRWDAWEASTCDNLSTELAAMLASDETLALPARAAATRLRVPALRGQARGTSEKAFAARRVLAWLEVQLAFYVPRDLLAQGAKARAAWVVRIAEVVREP